MLGAYKGKTTFLCIIMIEFKFFPFSPPPPIFESLLHSNIYDFVYMELLLELLPPLLLFIKKKSGQEKQMNNIRYVMLLCRVRERKTIMLQQIRIKKRIFFGSCSISSSSYSPSIIIVLCDHEDHDFSTFVNNNNSLKRERETEEKNV